jgi:hydroxymethylglutaryl-CoA reductase (NADPH)
MTSNTKHYPSVPRDKENNYTESLSKQRRDFVSQQSGQSGQSGQGVQHIGHYSVKPEETAGNIENFVGVAQVPIGLAGPILVDGEYANGAFYVPLATTEGTLVASYNRGMRVITAAGGAKVTVVDDAMQRAPVFIFEDARQARQMGEWIEDNFAKIKLQAETTTQVGQLRNIEQYAAARMRYLRFNFTTGDAAGQNMVSKACFAACEWIEANYPYSGYSATLCQVQWTRIKNIPN